MVSQRQANNPQMEDYNLSEPTSYTQYLDANNLHGWAMSQHFPVSEFVWVEPTDHVIRNNLPTPQQATSWSVT